MMQDRVDQGAAIVPRTRVHHLTRLLVDDQHMLVFEEDFEGEFFGEGACQWRRRWQEQLDLQTLAQLFARLQARTAHGNLARFESRTQLAARDRMPRRLNQTRDYAIGPLTIARLVDDDRKPLFFAQE